MEKKTIYLIHIFGVAPILILYGQLGSNLSVGENEGYKKYFSLLTVLGIMVILYHLFMLHKF